MNMYEIKEPERERVNVENFEEGEKSRLIKK